MVSAENGPLAWLLTRQSIGARHLGEPGPGTAELERMAAAALLAPDHGQRLPFRFKGVRGAAHAKLAALFEKAALDAGKDEAQARVDVERALAAPVSVALANDLNAAHALGYAGKMLSGNKVRHAAVRAAYCEPIETLLGWVSLGTPTRGHNARGATGKPGAIWQDWDAPPGR